MGCLIIFWSSVGGVLNSGALGSPAGSALSQLLESNFGTNKVFDTITALVTAFTAYGGTLAAAQTAALTAAMPQIKDEAYKYTALQTAVPGILQAASAYTDYSALLAAIPAILETAKNNNLEFEIDKNASIVLTNQPLETYTQGTTGLYEPFLTYDPDNNKTIGKIDYQLTVTAAEKDTKIGGAPDYEHFTVWSKPIAYLEAFIAHASGYKFIFDGRKSFGKPLLYTAKKTQLNFAQQNNTASSAPPLTNLTAPAVLYEWKIREDDFGVIPSPSPPPPANTLFKNNLNQVNEKRYLRFVQDTSNPSNDKFNIQESAAPGPTGSILEYDEATHGVSLLGKYFIGKDERGKPAAIADDITSEVVDIRTKHTRQFDVHYAGENTANVLTIASTDKLQTTGSFTGATPTYKFAAVAAAPAVASDVFTNTSGTITPVFDNGWFFRPANSGSKFFSSASFTINDNWQEFEAKKILSGKSLIVTMAIKQLTDGSLKVWILSGKTDINGINAEWFGQDRSFVLELKNEMISDGAGGFEERISHNPAASYYSDRITKINYSLFFDTSAMDAAPAFVTPFKVGLGGVVPTPTDGSSPVVNVLSYSAMTKEVQFDGKWEIVSVIEGKSIAGAVTLRAPQAMFFQISLKDPASATSYPNPYQIYLLHLESRHESFIQVRVFATEVQVQLARKVVLTSNLSYFKQPLPEGSYKASLKITDAYSFPSAVVSKSIAVSAAPKAVISPITAPCGNIFIGQTVMFDGQGSTVSQGGITYHWRLTRIHNDPQLLAQRRTITTFSEQKNLDLLPMAGRIDAKHTFTQPGIYAIHLTIQDEDGVSASDVRYFSAQAPAVIAGTASQQSVTAKVAIEATEQLPSGSMKYTFISQSFGGKAPYTLSWELNDNATNQTVVMSDTAPADPLRKTAVLPNGNYTVFLKATDADGNSNLDSYGFTVTAGATVASPNLEYCYYIYSIALMGTNDLFFKSPTDDPGSDESKFKILTLQNIEPKTITAPYNWNLTVTKEENGQSKIITGVMKKGGAATNPFDLLYVLEGPNAFIEDGQEKDTGYYQVSITVNDTGKGTSTTKRSRFKWFYNKGSSLLNSTQSVDFITAQDSSNAVWIGKTPRINNVEMKKIGTTYEVTADAVGSVYKLFETDTVGLVEGHIDIDISLSGTGSATTDGHVHEYDNKNPTAFNAMTIIDYFNITDAVLKEINHASAVGANIPFKLVVGNADLSKGARVSINNNLVLGIDYDNTDFGNLPIYTLDGSTGTKLTGLEIQFDPTAIALAKIHPTNTGPVKANTPGPNGEYRNGAFTLQAIRVDGAGKPVKPDGSSSVTLNPTKSNGGVQGVATAGNFLWETTAFWHWPKSPSYDALEWQAAYDQILAKVSSREQALSYSWSIPGAGISDAWSSSKTLSNLALTSGNSYVVELKVKDAHTIPGTNSDPYIAIFQKTIIAP